VGGAFGLHDRYSIMAADHDWCQKTPGTAFVATEGLKTRTDRPDFTHFDGPSHYLLGDRIYNASLNIDAGSDMASPLYPLRGPAGVPYKIGDTTMKIPAGAALDFAAIVLAAPRGATLIIAAGVVTVTRTSHAIDTEAAAAIDDLDTINGGVNGQMLFIRPASSARDIVVRHNIGNIILAGAANKTLLTNNGLLLLDWDSTIARWVEPGSLG